MSRFDFGKKNENCNEKAIVKYFEENNFFGLPYYEVTKLAKEFLIFTENYIVNCEDERKRIELLLRTRKEHDLKFPYSIGIQYDVVCYSQKTRDFAVWIPNTKGIHLYLFRPFDEALKHLQNKNKTKK